MIFPVLFGVIGFTISLECLGWSVFTEVVGLFSGLSKKFSGGKNGLL